MPRQRRFERDYLAQIEGDFGKVGMAVTDFLREEGDFETAAAYAAARQSVKGREKPSWKVTVSFLAHRHGVKVSTLSRYYRAWRKSLEESF